MAEDPELAHFINVEGQKQTFQQLVYKLTDTCWETCFADVRPSARLEAKVQNCFVNCVERFIDTTNFIVKRLETQPQYGSVGSRRGGLDMDL